MPSLRPSSKVCGYGAPEFWSDAGWQWRQRRNARTPGLLAAQARRGVDRPPLSSARRTVTARTGGFRQLVRGRRVVSLGRPAPSDRDRVGSRCHWRAEPLAARASPTVAGAGHGAAAPAANRANLDFAFAGPIDVAACAEGDSAFGCRQMIGNVWQWTASDFLPFAGFAADPYKDYSGSPGSVRARCLRGGCWATSARIARPSDRNFFTPDRNDVFAGFRTCAL